MREAVSDIIERRAHDPQGFRRSVTTSLLVHTSIIALLAFVYRGWIAVLRDAPKMMTISLGVSAGPRATGMTAIGGRLVEQASRLKSPEPDTPAAPRRELAINVPPKAAPDSAKPSKTPDPPPSSRPATGAEIARGTSLVETGAKSTGLGLTFGGGAGAPNLDLGANFCCPVYAQRILEIIGRDWQSVQPEKGRTVIVFTIHTDGQVTDTRVETSSGSFVLDQKSRLAIPASLLPLPAEFKQPTLTVHLAFPYGGS